MAIGDKAGLIFTIKADTADATAKVEKFRKELKEIDKASKDALSPLQNLAATSGFTAAQFDTLKTGVMAGVGAIGAVVGVAAAATAAVFALAKSASDFGSIIFDASQKTGLGAETLSALKFGADQAGTSFEQLTKGITVFGTEVGKAADGNEKAQEKMKALGVTSTDLNTALKQVFTTIINGKNDTDRLRLASEAFGKKIGPDLIPLIKDTNGNLDELIERAKELGVTLTDEDARAADEFGDQMDLLNAQLAGVGRTIGTELMPVFKDMAASVSLWLVQNKGQIKEWGQITGDIIRGIADAWTDAKNKYAEYLALVGREPGFNPAVLIPFGETIQQSLQGRGARIRQQQEIQNEPATELPGLKEFEERRTQEAKKATEDREKDREAAFQKELANREKGNQLMLKAERDVFADAQKAWEQAYIERKATEDEFVKASVNNIKAYSERVRQLIQNAFVLDSTGKSGTEFQNAELERANSIRALNRQIAQEAADVRKTVESQNKKIADAEKKSADDSQAERNRKLKSWKDFIEFQERLDKMEDEGREKRTQERNLQYKSWADHIRHLEDVDRKETEAVDRRAREEEALRKKQEQQTFDQIGGGIAGGFFGGLGLTVEKMTEEVNILSQLGDLLAQTFQQVASAVGQAVHSFVLFGSAGTSFRKFAAEVIASIAQMAVVQAVWEAAQGLAMLALAWFSGNPKYFKSATDHFLAAAAFAVIGGVAVGVGRAAAGSEFAQESGRATGGGSGGGTGEDEGNNELNLIDSPFRGFELRMRQENAMLRETLERTNVLLGANEEVVNNWAERLKLTSPGDVVRMGASDAGREIRSAYESEFEADGRATTEFFRKTGQYR